MTLTIPQLMGLGMPGPLATAIVGGDASLNVTDGSTTIASATQISFSGATVSSGGAGIADVSVSGGAGLLQSASVSLTSAQLKNLFTVPAQIVAAPGAGKLLIVMAAFANYTFGTQAYVSGVNGEAIFYANDLTANGAGGTANGVVELGISALTETNFAYCFPGTGGTALSVIDAYGFPAAGSGTFVSGGPSVTPVNQSLVYGSQVSNMTTGDGTLKITVYYVTQTV